MNLDRVTSGSHLPDDFNVIVEIPMNADPIKYEVDKETGAVIRCRPLGMLKMDDEAGGDAKLLAVPVDKVLPIYKHWSKPEDLQPERLMQIQHFFEHYKDLEPGKWVKVAGWFGPEHARGEIMAGVARYQKAGRKPMF